jgi:hypothetical protein
MKKINLLIALMILLGTLTQAKAALINIGNFVTYNSAFNTSWPQGILNTSLTLALSGSNREVPLLQAGMGNFKAIDPRNTIVSIQGSTGRGLITLWRNNHDTPAPVPEPSTMIFLGTGLVGLAGYIRIQNKNSN